MNAKHPTTSLAPLREQIARHLDAEPESTVKAIAATCGQAEYPSRIVGALNVMRTDGDVECEQRKGEMRYWLARPLDVILSGEQGAITAAPRRAETPPAPTRQTERAEQRREIIRTAIAGKTAAIGPTLKYLAEACECTVPAVEQLVAPMLSAGTVRKARTEGERFNRLFDPKAIAPPQPEVGENTGSDGSGESIVLAAVPEAGAGQEPAPAAVAPTAAPGAEDDMERLKCAAEQLALFHEICERYEIGDYPAGLAGHLSRQIELRDMLVSRATKAEAERDELAQQYKDKDAELLNQSSVVVSLRAELSTAEQKRIDTTGALTRSMQDLDTIRELLAPFSGDIDPSDMTEVELAQQAATLLVNLARTVENMAQGDPAVDVLDAASAYLIRIPKRRPRVVTKPEKVREAAVAAVRNGAERADVFALIPLGTAKRGAEWTDAN
ncbi:hypothetical protein [Aromatoleum toluclasticum]|uniref:hypothetical protein n=1 Tax=Aromatoleum toluclasticum TaxID=92003 RepID=UPI00037E4867|nr:hypothetical protein [Aromatoleum toluclasticum]